jgi:sterol 14-demethylase
MTRRSLGSTALAGSRPIPDMPGGLPWLGHAADFGRDPVRLLRRGREQVGNVFSFRLLGRRVVFLAGPAAHEAVFKADEAVLSAREAYRFMVPVFGAGVAYGAEPGVMDEQMGFVLGTLTGERMRAYAQHMTAEAEAYFRRWGQQGEVDLCAAMNELTVAIASRCLVGPELRSRLGSELPRLYHDLERGIRLAGLLDPRLPLPSFRRRERARRLIVQRIREILDERRTGAAPGEDDLLGVLASTRYADGRRLTDDEVAGLVLALVFAGQHTSAVLAAWTGVLLLDHPAHLAAAVAEQDALAAEPLPVAATLRQMPVLERCVKEAERLHPPLVVLMRLATGEFGYGGYRIPAGTLVMVSPGVAQRMPEVFRNPDVFDPDRFGPGREEDRRAPYGLISFGGGKHRCVGVAFAYQQVKVIWSVLLHRFTLELGRRPILPDYSTFVAGPREPCPVRYRRRPQANGGAGDES